MIIIAICIIAYWLSLPAWLPVLTIALYLLAVEIGPRSLRR